MWIQYEILGVVVSRIQYEIAIVRTFTKLSLVKTIKFGVIGQTCCHIGAAGDRRRQRGKGEI